MGPAYRIALDKGFQLVEVLGSGRFGKVYRAKQARRQRAGKGRGGSCVLCPPPAASKPPLVP